MHKSLYIQEKIFHRDILKNNIIIMNLKKINDFTEMLIDLNFVKMISSECSDMWHQTDTMKFMVIQMLQWVTYIYWHNFESFFYVFLWICTHHTWKWEFWHRTAEQLNILRKWYTDTFDDIAWVKWDYMHVDGFENVLCEFSWTFDCVKSLCRKIWDILFLYKNELLVSISLDSHNRLYDLIIKAFDDTITDIIAWENSE